MLALQPELEFAKDDRPINFAFVVDRSHSTTPELWTVARGLVEAMTGGMEAGDKFTVLACDAQAAFADVVAAYGPGELIQYGRA